MSMTCTWQTKWTWHTIIIPKGRIFLNKSTHDSSSSSSSLCNSASYSMSSMSLWAAVEGAVSSPDPGLVRHYKGRTSGNRAITRYTLKKGRILGNGQNKAYLEGCRCWLSLAGYNRLHLFIRQKNITSFRQHNCTFDRLFILFVLCLLSLSMSRNMIHLVAGTCFLSWSKSVYKCINASFLATVYQCVISCDSVSMRNFLRQYINASFLVTVHQCIISL